MSCLSAIASDCFSVLRWPSSLMLLLTKLFQICIIAPIFQVRKTKKKNEKNHLLPKLRSELTAELEIEATSSESWLSACIYHAYGEKRAFPVLPLLDHHACFFS